MSPVLVLAAVWAGAFVAGSMVLAYECWWKPRREDRRRACEDESVALLEAIPTMSRVDYLRGDFR